MTKTKSWVAITLFLIAVGACTMFFIMQGTASKTSVVEEAQAANVPEEESPSKETAKESESLNKSKNLIVLIGDGMGPPQVSLTRIYGQKYEGMDQLVLDDYLVGTNSTHADDSPDSEQSGIVTDSAASGTAFATGNKTYNGAVSVTNEEVAKPVASVLEAAKLAGKSTGLISTARITHATPAVYATHVRSRDNENAIASQYAESDIDVLLGGGERHFVANKDQSIFKDSKREDGVDLITKLKDKGYEVVYNKQALGSAKGNKLVGFFDSSHIPYNIDRQGEEIPSLKEQLEKAIEILNKNDQGFVIMLEGGRIDHAGHANDIHSVAKETLEFDEAFKAAIDFAQKDGQTSVIATADHETGGLTIGSRNVYDAYLDVFEKVSASSELIGKELEEAKGKDEVKAIVKKYTSIDDLTDEEVELILSGQLLDGSPSSYKREGSFNAVIAQRSMIGWTGHGHTAVDVGVYGFGPAAELLRGFTDNTDFAKAGAKALGLDLQKATKELQKKYLYPKYVVTEDERYLLPAISLSKELNFTVEEKDGAYTLAGANQSVVIEKNAKEMTLESKKHPVQIDGDQLYVSIEIIDHLTEKAIEWDELSERIILQ